MSVPPHSMRAQKLCSLARNLIPVTPRARIFEILCKVTAFSAIKKPHSDFYITLLYNFTLNRFLLPHRTHNTKKEPKLSLDSHSLTCATWLTLCSCLLSSGFQARQSLNKNIGDRIGR